MKNFFLNIWKYLKDWKNLLGHTLVGVGIILVSAFLPLPWWGRLIVLVALIVLTFTANVFLPLSSKRNDLCQKKMKKLIFNISTTFSLIIFHHLCIFTPY